jgi:hypothetical protein
MLAQNYADPPLAQQPRQALLAVAERQAAKVLAIKLQEVERVQHRVADGAMAMEGVEDRDPVRAGDDCLAVEREGGSTQLGRRGNDRRVAGALVIAASGEEAHGVAVTPDLQPIAVVLDLVHPVEPGGRLRSAGGNAGLDEPAGTNYRNHAFGYRLLTPPGKCHSVAGLSLDRSPMPGKRVQFDPETWHAVNQLAKDRMQDFQELADEAFADLLRKHGRPTDLKTALRQSVAGMDKQPPADSGAAACRPQPVLRVHPTSGRHGQSAVASAIGPEPPL